MDYSHIDEFEQFLKKEIQPAAKDIEKLEDKNRKHIQKLVYTNLVDRFDTMVDSSVLSNCREQSFSDDALKSATSPVTEAELITLLMQGDEIQDALTIRLQEGLRNSVLRERHSQKFRRLVGVLAPNSGADTPIPRVNISTGAIVEKFKIQDKQVPHSIVGYADWLYSRRNSIVHGAGTNRYLENDRRQIKKIFKVELKATFRITVGSITNAAKFYKEIIDILKSEE
ncbi:hypothetical protein [Maritimibacter sp. HL-12]|uniref:hypothetical protein n=1 Tax=Maritimibacter sp. HL-12 TaxID=1162418 RepID=UPI000A0F17C0|nr:hypothetical protein [Maritimibacter sp. HL-12]SMH32734.1 hypothetical protein SAMN05661107_0370 [Maritimibacter sp. HL-12]